MSSNQKIIPFPAVDAAAFVKNIKASRLAGNTLVLDFPFAAFPDNLGHWAELMVPIYNIMQKGDWARENSGDTEGSKPIIGMSDNYVS